MSVALILSLCSMILVALSLMSDIRRIKNRCGELEIELEHERSVSSRLRAADMIKRIEREENIEAAHKRAKMYEYAVKRNGNANPSYILVEDEARQAVKELNEEGVAVSLVRREVGEWEEVRND